MSDIRTYEVDLGNDSLSVEAEIEANGGKVIAVCFDAQLSNNSKAADMLDEILDDCEISSEVKGKLSKISNLIRLKSVVFFS
jgi:hypothetical protein